MLSLVKFNSTAHGGRLLEYSFWHLFRIAQGLVYTHTGIHRTIRQQQWSRQYIPQMALPIDITKNNVSVRPRVSSSLGHRPRLELEKDDAILCGTATYNNREANRT